MERRWGKDLSTEHPQSHTATSVGPSTLSGLETRRSKKRVATVYDAVSGRLKNRQGPSDVEQKQSAESQRLAKHSLRDAAYGPDEVLFRRKNAPVRYAEHDIYFSNERDLPDGGRGVLPESDLLGAVHGYASKFYGRLHRNRGGQRGSRSVDERSMDGSALLAFGILLEEAGREVLGRRGDLVFTEGEAQTSKPDAAAAHPAGDLAPDAFQAKLRSSKRRKLVDDRGSPAFEPQSEEPDEN